jgi:hypothetical protein
MRTEHIVHVSKNVADGVVSLQLCSIVSLYPRCARS